MWILYKSDSLNDNIFLIIDQIMVLRIEKVSWNYAYNPSKRNDSINYFILKITIKIQLMLRHVFLMFCIMTPLKILVYW